MAGRQRGIVIVGTPVARAARDRRQRDGMLPKRQARKLKAPIAQVGIVGRLAPGLAHARLQLTGKFGRQPRIAVQRQAGVLRFTSLASLVGWVEPLRNPSSAALTGQ